MYLQSFIQRVGRSSLVNAEIDVSVGRDGVLVEHVAAFAVLLSGWHGGVLISTCGSPRRDIDYAGPRTGTS